MKPRGRYAVIPAVGDSARLALPTRTEVVDVLRRNPLTRLRAKVRNAFVGGSFATGTARPDSDLDIIVVLDAASEEYAEAVNARIRAALAQHAQVRGLTLDTDGAQPMWRGRRIDPYIVASPTAWQGPRIELGK